MRPKVIPGITSILLTISLVQAGERAVKWDELAPAVVGRTVGVNTNDGAKISGHAIAVDPDRLTMNVKVKGRHERVPQSIERAQVKSVEVLRSTVRWRAIGTALGVAGGIPLGVIAAIEKDGLFSKGNGGTGVFVATIAGLGAAGYFLGWAADRHKTTFIITP